MNAFNTISQVIIGWLKNILRPSEKRVSDRGNNIQNPPEPSGRYIGTLSQSLAVFRFISFAMGAGLVFTTHQGVQTNLSLFLIVGLVGLYNILNVVLRLSSAKYGIVVQRLNVVADFLLSVTVVLKTGGLDSSFLIYALAPTLTASLLIDLGSALTVAGLLALSVSGAHLVSGLGLGDFPWILQGNYLAFSVLYTSVCLLVAYLPFQANLNWQRRVRSESAASERQRLRREVHDNVAQTLAFLSLKTKRAEERASEPRGVVGAQDVRDIAGAVQRAYLAVRDYLDGTGGVEMEGSLRNGLASAAEQWSRDTGLPVTFQATEGDAPLPPGVKLHLLQIAREAMANAGKHSMARRLWVSLKASPAEVTLRVRDNGRGFSPSERRGHGLNIMEERARMIGATLTVNSSPGDGTEVVAIYPRSEKKVEA